MNKEGCNKSIYQRIFLNTYMSCISSSTPTIHGIGIGPSCKKAFHSFDDAHVLHLFFYCLLRFCLRLLLWKVWEWVRPPFGFLFSKYLEHFDSEIERTCTWFNSLLSGILFVTFPLRTVKRFNFERGGASDPTTKNFDGGH